METNMLWADNCTAQNKNWTLYSALVYHINQGNPLKSLTIRYFEKGHTFMAADSFHKNVEDAMRHKKKLYDFNDFVECIDKHGTAIQMEPVEFKQFGNELSRGKDTKYPHISDVVEISFREGSTKMYWKEKLTDVEYKHGEFVQKKFRKVITAKKDIVCYDGPRGLNTQKLKDILQKLSPIIPKENLHFWVNMPTTKGSVDLTRNIDG